MQDTRKVVSAPLLLLFTALMVSCSSGDDPAKPGNGGPLGGSLSGSWSWVRYTGTASGTGCDPTEGPFYSGFIVDITHEGSVITVSDGTYSFQGAVNGNEVTVTSTYDDGQYSETETSDLVIAGDRNSMTGSSGWVYTEVGQSPCIGTSDVFVTRNLPGNCTTFDGVWALDQRVCFEPSCTYRLDSVTLTPAQEHCVFGGRFDSDQSSNSPLFGTIEADTIRFAINHVVSGPSQTVNLILNFDLVRTSPTRLEGTLENSKADMHIDSVVFLKQ